MNLLYLVFIIAIVGFSVSILKQSNLENIYNNIKPGDIFVLKSDEGNPFANDHVIITNRTKASGKYWIEYTVDGVHKRSKELRCFLDIYKQKKNEQ